MEHLIKPNNDHQILVEVTQESAKWQFLDFKVVALREGRSYSQAADKRERALVPLQGRGSARVSGLDFELGRADLWEELPHVLYVPPGNALNVQAQGSFEFAVGAAPAAGKYPVRLFKPSEMKAEVRGGGPARRQVNHILATPLPTERLILFEVYVPGGAWSGWPPHCHDGYMGSAYLEEVYYYRIRPSAGFALHRNYRKDTDFDELFVVRDGDLVLVTQGFHPVAAAPGSSVYFLNYLAGELISEGRGTPPYDDPDHAWILSNWDQGLLQLPMGGG